MLLQHDTSAKAGGARPLAVPFGKTLRAERARLLTALSLANLCFINVWYLCEQIPASSLNYYRNSPPDMTLLGATAISVVLLAAVFYVGWILVVRSESKIAVRLAKGLFLLCLSYPVEKLIRYLSPPPDQFSYTCAVALIVAETALLMGVMLVVLFNNHSVLKVARSCALVLALLFPSLAIDLTWVWAVGPSRAAFRDKPLAGLVADHRPAVKRVVWMVFDEFDQGLAFDSRSPGLQLPNLDRLRSESFSATQVNPTARWTMIAMPSLISGQLLSRADLIGASDLRIWPDRQNKPVSWHDQPSIFSKVREQHQNAAVFGWHHPYCRIMNEAVTSCYWEPSEQGSEEIEIESHCRRIGLAGSVEFLLEWKGEDVLAALNIGFTRKSVVDVQKSLRAAQAGIFQHIRERSLEAIADPRMDLVVIHWPTPHPYGIFDRQTRDFTTNPNSGYIDNLALVDRTVEEFQRYLREKGLLANTTLLVSSDHPFRRELWHGKFTWSKEMEEAVAKTQSAFVPFIVKFGEENQKLDYRQPFNAVLTSEIVREILAGNVRSGAGLESWLDANRTKAPLE